MSRLDLGIQYIVDNDGLGIAITGMTIVFSGLVLISLFISLLPMVLSVLERFLPSETSHHRTPAPSLTTAATPEGDEEELSVAIGFVLHRRMIESKPDG